jgi:hypothetical protein
MLARLRRSSSVPVALSFVMPGLGQAYNRQWGKAGAFGMGSLLVSERVTVEVARPLAEMSAKHLLVYAIALLGLWIFSMIDAGRIAARKADAPAQPETAPTAVP